MSTAAGGRGRSEGPADPPALVRLGYLLKHAQLDFAALSTAALAPYGVDGRELAVLTLLSGQGPLSQQELARRLGIDRTTMVALIDGLEQRKLVERNPHPADRRKNAVALTGAGRAALTGASRAADDAERRFLAPLGEAGARQFTAALRTLFPAPAPPPEHPDPP